MKQTVRLDRLLSTHGYGTRKEVKTLLRARAVTVNGVCITAADTHIDMQNDVLCVDGETLTLCTHVYLMMNKPQNVVCSNKDGEHAIVFDLLSDEYHRRFLGGELHCIGRLDIDTEGLLLLTTDGALTHRLTSPKTHKAKTYAVTLKTPVSAQQQTEYTESFLRGLVVPSENNESAFTAQSAHLEWSKPDTAHDTKAARILQNAQTKGSADTTHNLQNAQNTEYATECTLTIYEGKYHQVKRMFAAVGNKVTHLKRISIDTLLLDATLLPGEYRALTQEELARL